MKLFFEKDTCTLGRFTVDEQFKIEAENSDTVLQVKEKIQNSRGIPISDQTLIFKGSILHDDLTVEASGVADQSRIRLKMPEKNEEDTAYDGGDDDDEDITASPKKKKKMKAEAAGSSSNYFPIQIKLPPPLYDLVTLTVNADKTVRVLKRHISELFEAVKTASESSGRRLVLRNEKGIDLPDDKTLSECQISSESVVMLEIPPKMRLCLKISESDVFLGIYLRGEDTILQVKEIIHESGGVPVDQIVVKDDEGNELSDERTLTACGIMPDSDLAVEYQRPAVSSSSASQSGSASGSSPRQQVPQVVGSPDSPLEVEFQPPSSSASSSSSDHESQS